MDNRTRSAALAGLLHDIGKFAQRAGQGGSRIWDGQAQGDFGYYHALLTADFIDQYAPEVCKEAVKLMAVNHHRPQKREDFIVALADRLSAGERADPEDDAQSQPKQMLSIFCLVQADNRNAPRDAYLPLAPLSLDAQRKTVFPAPQWDEERVRQAYAAMWDEFCGQAKQLKNACGGAADVETYIENLLLLLQRYTWCIPSAYYKARPDVSLHDHNRMTAALAAALADCPLSDERLKELARSSDAAEEEAALLVGGDLGGIQEFLYTITARGATSALRGRSFYLQLLTEAAARFVLRQLGLPIVNLMYAGGGNFYLLARPGDAERLPEIHAAVSRALLHSHRGDVYLALAAVPLQFKDFHDGRISAAWERLAVSLQRVKQRRFAELGAEMSALFEPQGHGGSQEQQCQVCGCEHPHVRDDDGTRKCPACLSYESLGDDLRRAAYLLLEAAPPAPLQAGEPGGYVETLAFFGCRAKLLESSQLVSAPPGGILYALSDDDLQRALRKGIPAARKLLVNVTPILDEQVIELLRQKGLREDLRPGAITPFAGLELLSQGAARLGVLRMDMDNLGAIFENGLGAHASLSRIGGLSFAVSLYFEGWVETLAKTLNQRDADAGLGRRLYSIYSGGDDLFFVGAWDAVVELARQIRADLTPYAADHPGIHTSAGIVLRGGKYPLAQAAEEAGAAEEQAKALRRAAGGDVLLKNAVCFLGQALDWDTFGLQDCSQRQDIGSAHALMHLLTDDAVRDGKAAMPLVRRLIGFYERYRQALERRRLKGEEIALSGAQQVLWGPWMWLSAYSLSRLAKQYQTEADTIELVKQLLKRDNFRSIEWSGLAARWAELKLRKN